MESNFSVQILLCSFFISFWNVAVSIFKCVLLYATTAKIFCVCLFSFLLLLTQHTILCKFLCFITLIGCMDDDDNNNIASNNGYERINVNRRERESANGGAVRTTSMKKKNIAQTMLLIVLMFTIVNWFSLEYIYFQSTQWKWHIFHNVFVICITTVVAFNIVTNHVNGICKTFKFIPSLLLHWFRCAFFLKNFRTY